MLTLTVIKSTQYNETMIYKGPVSAFDTSTLVEEPGVSYHLTANRTVTLEEVLSQFPSANYARQTVDLIFQAIPACNKLNRIKALRDFGSAAGVPIGLKEAKEAVESYQ